jgi:hypothetical protein
MKTGTLLLAMLLGCAGGGGTRSADPDPPVDDPSTAEGTCAQEISLACGPGMVDGCLQKGAGGAALTLVHICVAESEKPGQPCSQEIARECPAGQEDACLSSPPAAATHVCVAPNPPAP